MSFLFKKKKDSVAATPSSTSTSSGTPPSSSISSQPLSSSHSNSSNSHLSSSVTSGSAVASAAAASSDPFPSHSHSHSHSHSQQHTPTSQTTTLDEKTQVHNPTSAASLSLMTNSQPDDEVARLRKHFESLGPNLSKKIFTIGDTLGTGTFGRVRLVTYAAPNAQGQSSKRYYALKMLKKSEIIRLKQVEHIKAEKSILSHISHPFIVNLYASFQDERNLFMLMEYVIGGELFSQLRKVGRFSNDTSRFYAAEIVLALQYLHSMNIVYRDLKPENLLIDKDGHMKITDFGFAKEVEDRTWTLCGTPEYLAPEIIQSKGHGKAVDWWALGILIYEMLAGYPPFYDENPFGIYQKILSGRIEFPKHFDPHAKDLVKKLLTADRTKRFGCLKDGAEDIKRHKWFKSVDWVRVYQRRVKPPYVPGYTGLDDTSNFDKYPDSEEDHTPPLQGKDAAVFADF